MPVGLGEILICGLGEGQSEGLVVSWVCDCGHGEGQVLAVWGDWH